MKKIKMFIKNNKKFIIWTSILLIGNAFMYWFIKLFQKNPISINYYLDERIPFIGNFIYIYNLFYPFILFSLFILYKNDEKNYYKAIINGTIGFIICDIIYLFIPTIMYRNIIPSINPLTDLVIKITFYFDNPPLNCFPSIHCLFCFQVIYSLLRSKYDIKKKIPIILFVLLIVISTLFVKQHYIYDVISALLICLIVNLITELFNIEKILKKKKII